MSQCWQFKKMEKKVVKSLKIQYNRVYEAIGIQRHRYAVLLTFRKEELWLLSMCL